MSNTCKNCKYWQVYFEDNCSPAQGVKCTQGYGRTDPDDTCDEFYREVGYIGSSYEGSWDWGNSELDKKLRSYRDYLDE